MSLGFFHLYKMIITAAYVMGTLPNTQEQANGNGALLCDIFLSTLEHDTSQDFESEC